MSESDVDRIATYLKIRPADFRRRFTLPDPDGLILKSHPNHDCVFLEGTVCTIHDVKPSQCVKWPFWPEVIEKKSNFEFAKSYCQGLKHFNHEQFLKVARRPVRTV